MSPVPPWSWARPPGTDNQDLWRGRDQDRHRSDTTVIPTGGSTYALRMGRYGKRADLIVHREEPFNAETGLAALAEGSLTATDAFYVRGHGAVPEVDA